MKLIKAVIFDWAGTLIDYGSIAPAAVFREVFARHGISLSLQEVRAFMGMAKKDHVRALLQTRKVSEQWEMVKGSPVNEQAVELLYAELDLLLKDVVARYSQAIPGASGLIRRLRETGIKIGSTTGYSGEVMEIIKTVAIAQGINPDVIITPDDVPSGRPAPFMVYKNAIELKAYPLHAMVKIGDTEADIKEGLNAGLWTIGYTLCGNEVGLPLEEIVLLPGEAIEHHIEIATEKMKKAGAHFICQGPEDVEAILSEINDLIAKGKKP